MNYPKDGNITALEQSLINFFSQKRDLEDKIPGGLRRLKSVSLGLNIPDDGSTPCFTVRIGVCEAAFDIEQGTKQKGSCYGLERYIRDWFQRESVQAEFKACVSQK